MTQNVTVPDGGFVCFYCLRFLIFKKFSTFNFQLSTTRKVISICCNYLLDGVNEERRLITIGGTPQ